MPGSGRNRRREKCALRKHFPFKNLRKNPVVQIAVLRRRATCSARRLSPLQNARFCRATLNTPAARPSRAGSGPLPVLPNGLAARTRSPAPRILHMRSLRAPRVCTLGRPPVEPIMRAPAPAAANFSSPRRQPAPTRSFKPWGASHSVPRTARRFDVVVVRRPSTDFPKYPLARDSAAAGVAAREPSCDNPESIPRDPDSPRPPSSVVGVLVSGASRQRALAWVRWFNWAERRRRYGVRAVVRPSASQADPSRSATSPAGSERNGSFSSSS